MQMMPPRSADDAAADALTFARSLRAGNLRFLIRCSARDASAGGSTGRALPRWLSSALAFGLGFLIDALNEFVNGHGKERISHQSEQPHVEPPSLHRFLACNRRASSSASTRQPASVGS